MKQALIGSTNPTASICINKSKIKLYNKEKDPTYYLNNGQQFEIELFNPTQNTILAKISINGNQIAQNGLVLRPGERVFLERYIDVAKKFLFETYEVENTTEAMTAIENNGNFSVKFYNEQNYNGYYNYYNGTITSNLFYSPNLFKTNNLLNTTCISNTSDILRGSLTTSVSYDTSAKKSIDNRFEKANLRSKSIETGRIEAGEKSEQKLEYVNKQFSIYPFHTIEYKLLPISQKINTTDDIKVRQYCSSCGYKLGKTDRFCSSCGNKI